MTNQNEYYNVIKMHLPNNLGYNYAAIPLQLVTIDQIPIVDTITADKPGQVITQYEFIDEEERSWAELCRRNLKRLVDEGEL